MSTNRIQARPTPTSSAFVFTDYGGPETQQLIDRPSPSPGPGELAIEVKAAGVNPVDWKIRSGRLVDAAAIPVAGATAYDLTHQIELDVVYEVAHEQELRPWNLCESSVHRISTTTRCRGSSATPPDLTPRRGSGSVGSHRRGSGSRIPGRHVLTEIEVGCLDPTVTEAFSKAIVTLTAEAG